MWKNATLSCVAAKRGIVNLRRHKLLSQTEASSPSACKMCGLDTFSLSAIRRWHSHSEFERKRRIVDFENEQFDLPYNFRHKNENVAHFAKFISKDSLSSLDFLQKKQFHFRFFARRTRPHKSHKRNNVGYTELTFLLSERAHTWNVVASDVVGGLDHACVAFFLLSQRARECRRHRSGWNATTTTTTVISEFLPVRSLPRHPRTFYVWRAWCQKQDRPASLRRSSLVRAIRPGSRTRDAFPRSSQLGHSQDGSINPRRHYDSGRAMRR